MTAHHLDRLSPMDASFLSEERDAAHMHIGGVAIFEGPPPEREDLIEHLSSRLHLVPRYRQKLAFPRFEMGRPFWVDDSSFNLEYHVRHTALPAPGTRTKLSELVARVFSQRLDRRRPLWELWLVQGLEDNRFAVLIKTHHALVDGVSGVDIAGVLFDFTPTPAEVPPEEGGWAPSTEPTQLDLVAKGIEGAMKTPIGLAAGALRAVSRPGRTVRTVREAAEGLGEIAWAGLNPAPDTPFNVAIGPHRRLTSVTAPLADFKAVKDALGGTVNDVVLTVVAGGLRTWLRSRGVRTEGLELRALVPVSIRSDDDRGGTGNQIAAVRGPLPVYVDDAVERLGVVREAMRDVKDSKQAIGAGALTTLEGFAPPTVLAQASRLNFSTRLFNLIVTNVPGPQIPFYLLGRELTEVVPIAFLPENHALAIAIISYNGRLSFGLLADYDVMPDLDDFGAMLQESLDELVRAAGEGEHSSSARSSGEGTRAPTGA